jgi:hypothetical protein
MQVTYSGDVDTEKQIGVEVNCIALGSFFQLICHVLKHVSPYRGQLLNLSEFLFVPRVFS